MERGVLFGFLGILLIGQSFCLKKSQEANSLAGAYFFDVGTYNFIDTRDETFLTSYTLTGLENALSNAKSYNEKRFLKEILNLEENLNKIYKVCGKNRKNFLPYGSTLIPENQLEVKVGRALNDSMSILSDLVSLVSKNYTEKFGVKEKMNVTNPYSNNYKYLYPKYISDFEVAKKYINFTLGLEKISRNAAVINVRMAIPILIKGDLKRIIYIPRQKSKSAPLEYVKDQSVNNLVVFSTIKNYDYYNSANYFLIKNMDFCELINETFLCEPEIMVKVQNCDNTCVTRLYNSNCNRDYNYECSIIEEKCGYESKLGNHEFTYLGNNKVFALMSREANYIYKCADKRREEGKLIFDKWIWNSHPLTGTIEIEENCSLITAHASVHNNDGVFEVIVVDDEDMIWADVPKIIGVPVWIFIIVVACVALIVLILLVTSICVCIRRCKAKKPVDYSTLNQSG